MRVVNRTALVALAIALVASQAAAQTTGPLFTAFETGPVRPMAMSADGTRLFATNIPDNRLEIFTISGNSLLKTGSVHVGLEPCAVAVRSNSEVWVVNHLSDSISIVDVSANPPRVTRTLLVGDEPRDIVFAAGGSKAFITTAHRGQHRVDASIAAVPGAGDPELTTPGVGRSDVWVFDAANLGATLGGTPLKILNLFGDTPRALAVSPDGNTVYAAVFHSGNQTSVVTEGVVRNGFTAATAGREHQDTIVSPNGLAGGNVPGGLPGPSTNHEGITAPEVGLIVKYNNANGQWQDTLGRNWSNGIRFTLPDRDVFAINANTLAESQVWTGVGTILFNMVVGPTGKIYVSNTEANNLVRFEGPGGGGSTVQGKLGLSRITILDGSSVTARHLNKHIDYSVLPAPPGIKDHSLATPVDMAITADGSKLYVAAFGSSKIGVFNTATLENDSFNPTSESANYINVSGGGPSGLVLDETNNRLYVMTRFDNSISVINPTTKAELAHISMHNPEPSSLVAGRPILYDAIATSSNGEASCASCHIFGDLDSLAWDLGNPDDDVTTNTIPINLEAAAGDQNGGAGNDQFHPMKGPMTTQTLRGMQNHGGLHWRGDRVDGFFGQDAPYVNSGSDRGDESLNFRNFIVAFPGLVGSERSPNDVDLQADMQKFTDFQMQVMLPPNPVRNLDNSLKGDVNNDLTLDERSGFEFFTGTFPSGRCSDGFCSGSLGFRCNGCHELNAAAGFFGAGGLASFEDETQIIKVAHLRNLYTKVGMFGLPDISFFNGTTTLETNNLSTPDSAHKGNQIRGFGFLHDGSTDTLYRFFHADVFNNTIGSFNPQGFNVGGEGATTTNANRRRRSMELYMLAFDNDIAPVVGQQITLTSSNAATVGARIDLLRIRASTPWVYKGISPTGFPNARECDLVATGFVNGEERSYRWDPAVSSFDPDRAAEANITDANLRSAINAAGESLTYTCYPPGAAARGTDRDIDGFLNRDELDAGCDPADGTSQPPCIAPTETPTFTPSHTAAPTHTPTDTVPPTATPTNTPLPSSTPTDTPVPTS
ncbi:MAG TPA: hypothetical protein VEB21_05450, partial [Terriglobales bacterium]|nr:hypothetical protein [Terriglobales bacterium]